MSGERDRGGAVAPRQRAVLDTGVPHIARVYDYWLGGKDNFAADRKLAEQFKAADPAVVAGVRSNRAFLGRAVHYLTTEAGIRQFLDIGTGGPLRPRGWSTSTATRSCCCTPGRCWPATRRGPPPISKRTRGTPGLILRGAASTLDFTRPVALMLVGLLHCIPDGDDPRGLVAALVAGLPAGSYLVISHPASDIHADAMAEGASMMNRALAGKITFRPRAEVLRFFAGLELVEPGLVSTTQWRAGPGADTRPLPGWAGVAMKP